MRAVLDTNVLLSIATANAAQDGPLFDIQQALRRGAFDLVLSEPILAELERNLAKPYFTDRLNASTRRAFVTALRRVALIQTITTDVSGVATHPEDDAILATALDARADMLVTGDRGLQRLARYHTTTILAPAQFAALLREPRPIAA